MTHVYILMGVVVVGLGGFWLALKLAEAKGRAAESKELHELSNAELVKRVRDALRAGDSVSSDPTKLREDDGHRRD
jgi:hypothetical protein